MIAKKSKTLQEVLRLKTKLHAVKKAGAGKGTKGIMTKIQKAKKTLKKIQEKTSKNVNKLLKIVVPNLGSKSTPADIISLDLVRISVDLKNSKSQLKNLKKRANTNLFKTPKMLTSVLPHLPVKNQKKLLHLTVNKMRSKLDLPKPPTATKANALIQQKLSKKLLKSQAAAAQIEVYRNQQKLLNVKRRIALQQKVNKLKSYTKKEFQKAYEAYNDLQLKSKSTKTAVKNTKGQTFDSKLKLQKTAKKVSKEVKNNKQRLSKMKKLKREVNNVIVNAVKNYDDYEKMERVCFKRKLEFETAKMKYDKSKVGAVGLKKLGAAWNLAKGRRGKALAKKEASLERFDKVMLRAKILAKNSRIVEKAKKVGAKNDKALLLYKKQIGILQKILKKSRKDKELVKILDAGIKEVRAEYQSLKKEKRVARKIHGREFRGNLGKKADKFIGSLEQYMLKVEDYILNAKKLHPEEGKFLKLQGLLYNKMTAGQRKTIAGKEKDSEDAIRKINAELTKKLSGIKKIVKVIGSVSFKASQNIQDKFRKEAVAKKVLLTLNQKSLKDKRALDKQYKKALAAKSKDTGALKKKLQNKKEFLGKSKAKLLSIKKTDISLHQKYLIARIRLNLKRQFENFHRKFLERINLTKKISENIHKGISSQIKSLSGVINKKPSKVKESDAKDKKRKIFAIKSYKELAKSYAQQIESIKVNKILANLKSQFKIAKNKIKNAFQAKRRSQILLSQKTSRAAQKKITKKILKYKSQLATHKSHPGITKILKILLARSEAAKEKLISAEETLMKDLTASIGRSKKFRMNIISLITKKHKAKLQVGQTRFVKSKIAHKKNHKEILLLQDKVVALLSDKAKMVSPETKELDALQKKLAAKRKAYNASGAVLNKNAKSLKVMVNMLSKF